MNEIAFINSLEAQNKKIEVQEKHQVSKFIFLYKFYNLASHLTIVQSYMHIFLVSFSFVIVNFSFSQFMEARLQDIMVSSIPLHIN